MDLTGVFALIALMFLLGAFFLGSQIANELRARGMSVNKLLLRFMIFKYMADYRQLTLNETGKVGPLYQPCAILLMLTAVFCVCAILARFL